MRVFILCHWFSDKVTSKEHKKTTCIFHDFHHVSHQFDVIQTYIFNNTRFDCVTWKVEYALSSSSLSAFKCVCVGSVYNGMLQYSLAVFAPRLAYEDVWISVCSPKLLDISVKTCQLQFFKAWQTYGSYCIQVICQMFIFTQSKACKDYTIIHHVVYMHGPPELARQTWPSVFSSTNHNGPSNSLISHAFIVHLYKHEQLVFYNDSHEY